MNEQQSISTVPQWRSVSASVDTVEKLEQLVLYYKEQTLPGLPATRQTKASVLEWIIDQKWREVFQSKEGQDVGCAEKPDNG